MLIRLSLQNVKRQSAKSRGTEGPLSWYGNASVESTDRYALVGGSSACQLELADVTLSARSPMSHFLILFSNAL